MRPPMKTPAAVAASWPLPWPNCEPIRPPTAAPPAVPITSFWPMFWQAPSATVSASAAPKGTSFIVKSRSEERRVGKEGGTQETQEQHSRDGEDTERAQAHEP